MNLDELHFVARRLKDATEQAMTGGRELHLSPAEGVVIADLLRHGQSRIRDITGRTGFAQSRVSTAVAALRDRGWVTARVDPADRRRTLVDVTPEIRRHARQATRRSAEPVLEQLLPGLPDADRAQVADALHTLHAALTLPDPTPTQGPPTPGGTSSSPRRAAVAARTTSG